MTLAIWLLLINTHSPIYAQTSGLAIITDNDVFAEPNRDKDYTFAGAVSYWGEDADDYGFTPAPVLKGIDRLLGVEDVNVANSLTLGLEAFTPEDVELTTPILDDRPYASLLFVGSSRSYANELTKTAVHTELRIGALGTNVANVFQDKLHNIDFIRGDRVNGYRNQISDGGELTFKYHYSKQAMLLDSGSPSGRRLQTFASFDANLGYLTDAGFSLFGRWGRFSSPWWSHAPQLGDYMNTAMPLVRGNAGDWTVYAGLKLRARGYNALLQGQFQDSEVTLDSDDLNRGLADLWLGAEYHFGGGYALRYSAGAQSSEIDLDNGDRTLVWGRLELLKTF